MANGIHESLLSLAVDIDTLFPLDNNPRRGNVEAIMSSYAEFGQIKPIVVRPNGDGTSTVIAGNHQFEAAKRLGWDKIAAVEYDVDDKRAIAFALADNRTMELGYTEPELLNDFVLEISDYYPELMDGLGWDEFDIAEIEQKSIRESHQVVDSGEYRPPVIVNPNASFDNPEDLVDDEEDSPTPIQPRPSVDMNTVEVTKTRDGQQLSAKSGVDQRDAAIRGSTTVSPSSAPQAVVQYTLVFDSPQQQSRWYDFIRWLRSDPGIDGSTTAERLMNFIDEHCEI